MKNVLYITNKEVPYRVKFFNELSKYCNLKVIFQSSDPMNRNREWAKSVKNNFDYEFIRQNKMKFIGILKEIKKYKYDEIIFGCANDINQIIPMLIMRLFNKKYIVNLDGECFIGNSFKDKLKIWFLKYSKKILEAGEESAQNIEKLVNKDVIPYYFSSMTEKEIEKNNRESKNTEREDFILVVGRYINVKGLDVAVKVAEKLPNLNFKFIGIGYETQEFQKYVDSFNVKNIEIIPFLQTKELFMEFKKCKMLLLPSRKECWGLVVNEAASFGTPIVSTFGSGAAVEFLSPQYKCYLANTDDVNDLLQKVVNCYENDNKNYSKYLLEKSNLYTIERSVKIHMDVINE